MKWVNVATSGAVLLAGHSLAAQDALDRTDPFQQIERERPAAQPEESVRIATQPVLDTPANTVMTDGAAVGAIVIDGLVALDRADFAPVIEPYAGRRLDHAELRSLADAVANHARERGYILATAWIAQQALVGGVLRITVDEGGLDDIRIEGSDDPAIRKQLRRLLDHQPLTLAALQREVLLADDLPGVWIRDTRFERDGDRRVLVVDARREDFAGSALVASDGTKPVGPVRARINLDANGLISPYDRVDLSFSATPLDPEELAFFSARYSMVVNDSGTSVGAFGSYSRTEPGAYLAARELLGTSWRGGLRMRHPLLRSQRGSLWLEASAELQDLQQDSLGSLARHDRIALARLGFYGFGPLAGGTLQGRATVSQGLDILGATALGDPLASRSDAPPGFTTLSWWLNWRRGLAARLSLSLEATGQLSADPLLIGENFALGGNSFLRGYDFAQRIGDQGIAGVGELRYDWPDALGAVERLQLYAFADGGTVTNLGDGRGSGTLASSGAGLRTDINRSLDFDLEVAVPLTEPRYDTDDNSPRINIRVSQSF
ncbi:ShlB/FhaC/HecB family hemolysin secretion/activation protein [Erythrobacter sp.]|uniref:ShlB/FhaC/HecB family hemolysin secretion/activation protein n=1 Tax=Erythrobacter sp. TaxID=1042 RepID=UPI0025DE7CEB|nr:ShlB/FhaC/HecB family hemolysin secretion/activation protein [Erythrobacter sp.]